MIDINSVKESNPKDAIGSTKIGLSNIPWGPVFEAALGMTEGSLKYRRHNYRAIGVRASIYFDALQRHMISWWEGEDIDPKSGIHHIGKAISTLLVLRDAMMQEKFYDDRPPKTKDGTSKWIDDFNEKVAELMRDIPEHKPPYTATGDT